MKIAPFLLVLLLSGLTACVTLPRWARWGGDPPPPTAPEAPVGPVDLVQRVTTARLSTMESYPLQYQLSARGTVPTAGWSQGQLRARPVLRPPADGVYDYEFLARPPSGMAAQVITPVEAATAINLPPGARGVRVHSRTNAEVVFLR